MRRFSILLCCLFLLAACGGSDETGTGPAASTLEATPVATLTPDPDAALSDETSVVDTVANLPEFQSLTALLRQTGLTDKLQSAGPYVLLAPTDAAFEALPPDVLAGLTADENDLADVLMYHIIEGDFDAAALQTAQSPIPTLLGDDFDPDGATFGEELPASNGRVYPIDRVLIPSSVQVQSPEADQQTLTEQVATQEAEQTAAAVDQQSGAPENPTVETEPVEELTEQQIIDKASASGTILDILSANDNFSLLTELLNATELARTLSEDAGPFTFFAPTDDAVSALGQETIDLLLSEPRARLSPILSYHLTDNPLTSLELVDLAPTELLMVGYAKALISVEDGAVFIGDARIIQFDIQADNGIIHVIDNVLIPTTERESLLNPDSVFEGNRATEDEQDLTKVPDILNLMDSLIGSNDANILVNLIQDADLTDVLGSSEGGPYTIFAPTDSAFRDLPEGTLEELSNGPVGNLAPLLLYHVVPGELSAADFADGELDTMANQPLTITVDDDTIFVNDAQIVSSDLIADNGVIHFIDKVLLPEGQ